jgi:hypothetical protein
MVQSSSRAIFSLMRVRFPFMIIQARYRFKCSRLIRSRAEHAFNLPSFHSYVGIQYWYYNKFRCCSLFEMILPIASIFFTTGRMELVVAASFADRRSPTRAAPFIQIVFIRQWIAIYLVSTDRSSIFETLRKTNIWIAVLMGPRL